MGTLLALRPWSERDFHLPLRVVYPIPWLLVVRVDVREPADAASDNSFEVLAVLVKEDVILLFVRDICHRIWTVGLYTFRGDRRPAILDSCDGNSQQSRQI